VTLANRYAGNSTVIGFDLDNEPHDQYGHNPGNWGKGGPADIRAMYTRVGNAIQRVDPGALIICEGFMDNTDKSSNIWWVMDLTHVATEPVVLHIPHKVVYSPHEYPNMRNGGGGPKYVARLNEDWGYLITRNVAPVWIGEMGASMDQKDGSNDIMIPDEIGWGNTILPYMNGLAPGGIRLTKNEQPVSGDWWRWEYAPGESPDGCLAKDGKLNSAQEPYIEQMLFWPKGHAYSLLNNQ
jgi:endoglucanase/chitinase